MMMHHASKNAYASGHWAPSGSDYSQRPSADSALKQWDGGSSSASSFFAAPASLLKTLPPMAPKRPSPHSANRPATVAAAGRGAAQRPWSSPYIDMVEREARRAGRGKPQRRASWEEPGRERLSRLKAQLSSVRRWTLGEVPSDFDISKMRNRNIAPVKKSFVVRLTPEEQEQILILEAQRHDDDWGRKSLTSCSLDDIDRCHNERANRNLKALANRSATDVQEDISGDIPADQPLQQFDGHRSLNLQDVFDGTEGAPVVEPPPLSVKPLPSVPKLQSRSEMPRSKSLSLPLEPTCTAGFLRMHSLPAGSVDEEDSDEDKCGWLPWPKRDDDDDDDSIGGDGLLEPFPQYRSRRGLL